MIHSVLRRAGPQSSRPPVSERCAAWIMELGSVRSGPGEPLLLLLLLSQRLQRTEGLCAHTTPPLTIKTTNQKTKERK